MSTIDIKEISDFFANLEHKHMPRSTLELIKEGHTLKWGNLVAQGIAKNQMRRMPADIATRWEYSFDQIIPTIRRENNSSYFVYHPYSGEYAGMCNLFD